MLKSSHSLLSFTFSRELSCRQYINQICVLFLLLIYQRLPGTEPKKREGKISHSDKAFGLVDIFRSRKQPSYSVLGSEQRANSHTLSCIFILKTDFPGSALDLISAQRSLLILRMLCWVSLGYALCFPLNFS